MSMESTMTCWSSAPVPAACGLRASRPAYGAKVAIVEEHRIGGTCVMRGCVPKKLLVYGAHFAEDLEDARRFGWQLAGAAFDWPTLRDNVLAEVTRLSGLYAQTLRDARRRDLRTGTPSSPGRTPCAIDDRNIGAQVILIATGARPQIPQVPGIEHAITSNEAFHLERLPARILIAGGGYIANEFAGIFNELGSKVTLRQPLRPDPAQLRRADPRPPAADLDDQGHPVPVQFAAASSIERRANGVLDVRLGDVSVECDA